MLNVFGMSGDRYDALLPWRIPVRAAATNRSVRSFRRSDARTYRSSPRVRGWKATATSAGRVSVGRAPAPLPAAGTRVPPPSGAVAASARAVQLGALAAQARRAAATR